VTKLPIFEGIEDYLKEDNAPFSMPGHKSGRGFMSTEQGKKLYKSLINGDITEVEGLDNLHKPEGIIKNALQLLSKAYGSYKSYFLVNGSTSGNLAMIFSAFNEGDKVIVERNCHRSIFNGIIMRKLAPIYIKNKISRRFNAPLSIDMEHFLQLIHNNLDAKGIIITYPNYYGVCVNIREIIKIAKEKNMFILVDSAHGAHFGFNDNLPESAIRLGADMVVMSAHKTLPSLTQTAYLHVSNNVNINRVDFYVSSFSTTSPSYMLLASMDYARYYMESKGAEDFQYCIEMGRKYIEKINLLEGFRVLSKKDLLDENPEDIYDFDESRYIINMKDGYSGHKLIAYLRKNGVQAELSDESNVVLILSPFNNETDFIKLYNALRDCPMMELISKSIPIKINKFPYVSLMPYEVADKVSVKVKLNESIGKICAVNIVPYPPGIPILISGEVIDKEAIAMIQYYLYNDVTVLGIENDSLLIVQEGILK
jgi:Arginine/lysine/ornithine decarboxylases